MPEFKEIGTVEFVNTPQLFAFDGETPLPKQQAVVDVGTVATIYSDGVFVVYTIPGWFDTSGIRSLGEPGLFILQPGPVKSTIPVLVPSKMFTIAEFKEYLEDPACQPGNPSQRRLFKLTEEI